VLKKQCKEEKKKTKLINCDTLQDNEKRLTYISLFDGLSCNQSLGQKQTQTKNLKAKATITR
jgi:hypothetical protein